MWFRRKAYGWGWESCSWQGWVVTGLYVLGTFWAVFEARVGTPETDIRKFFILIGLLTFLFMAVAWDRSEPPRWQWGGKPI